MKSSGKSRICIVELYKSLGKFLHCFLFFFLDKDYIFFIYEFYLKSYIFLHYKTHKNLFTKYLFFDKIYIHIILISDYFGSKLETCLYCNQIPRINVEKVKSVYESPKIVQIHNQWVFFFNFILIHILITI